VFFCFLKVLWFVWNFLLLRALKIVGALVCVLLSACFFWSEGGGLSYWCLRPSVQVYLLY
jgi:hypothetical protein